MALAATLLATISDSTDASQYVSGSFTPSADALLVVAYASGSTAGPPPRFVPSGGSLTFEEELYVPYSGAPPVRNIGKWVAPVGGSPSSMTVTLDAVDSHSSGTTATFMLAHVYEITDHNPDWPFNQMRFAGDTVNESSQVTGNSTDDDSMLLNSALDADNRPIMFHTHRNSGATTFRTDWTELADSTVATPAHATHLQWRSDTFEAQGSASWASAAAHAEAIFEINHSATTPVKAAKTPTGWETAGVATSPVSVAMPDGVEVGNLLLAFIAVDSNATVAAGGGEGWTEISNTANGTATRLVILAKLAAGSDALTLTLGGSVDVAVRVQRVTRHGVSDVSTDIEVATAATGTDASPNPPTLSPSTTKDWLFFAVSASDDDDNPGAGGAWWPTSYFGLAQKQSASSTTSCLIQVATRTANTGSAETPDAFVLAAAEEWVAQTIAVPPEAAGTTVNGSITTVLGGLTATAVGQRIVHGAIATVLGALTATAVGQRTVHGSITTVLGGLTATAVGTVPVVLVVGPPDRYFAPSRIAPSTGPRILSAL